MNLLADLLAIMVLNVNYRQNVFYNMADICSLNYCGPFFSGGVPSLHSEPIQAQ